MEVIRSYPTCPSGDETFGACGWIPNSVQGKVRRRKTVKFEEEKNIVGEITLREKIVKKNKNVGDAGY